MTKQANEFRYMKSIMYLRSEMLVQFTNMEDNRIWIHEETNAME
jgi:hypothetical protein